MLKEIRAYLSYFFYLGWNWNFRLAFTILYYEIRGERKYGIQTIGIDDLSASVAEQDRKHASIYQPVNYFIAEWLFGQLNQEEIKGKSFLDAGCGKGRAMVMAAAKGFGKVTGFDISPQLCNQAIQNLERHQNSYPNTIFSISCLDAKDADITNDISVIFMFNPFDKLVMKAFITRVMYSLEQEPRRMQILYANPECRQLWEAEGFKAVKSIRKLGWLQGLILEYTP